jgi:uncharacterized protein
MQTGFPSAITLALERFQLPQDSIHGICHWARVMENGLRLAPRTGADPKVVALFAIFHDVARENDKGDRMHGPRAVKWLEAFNAFSFGLDEDQMMTLKRAVGGHTNRLYSSDPTIATCWDADRLDIGRTGMDIDIDLLNTFSAKSLDILEWAQARGSEGQVPDFALSYI